MDTRSRTCFFSPAVVTQLAFSNGFCLRPARLIALSLGVLGLWACDGLGYPRDPDGTLRRVLETGRMRVAAIDHVPWVVVEEDGVPRGAEVDLVEGFAHELGVAIEWRRAPAFSALEALERGDLDLAVGGFTKKAVTAQGGAGLTHAYFTEALVVATDPSAPVPRDLDGLKVHVAPNLMANTLVEDEGGVPVPEKTEVVYLTLLPDWQVPARGLVPTDVILNRDEHVMAVPQGENAWIMRLELFLRRHADGTATRLREHAP